MQLSVLCQHMEQGFNTGLESGGRKIASKVGAFAAGTFGGEGGEYAEDYEQFRSASRSLGMDSLKALGSNDTERELLIALQANPSPDKEDGSNLAIIAYKIAAAEIHAEKADLMEQWLNRNLSLSNKDESGRSWDQFWRQYQLEQYDVRRNGLLQQITSARSVNTPPATSPPSVAPPQRLRPPAMPNLLPSNDASHLSEDDILKALRLK